MARAASSTKEKGGSVPLKLQTVVTDRQCDRSQTDLSCGCGERVFYLSFTEACFKPAYFSPFIRFEGSQIVSWAVFLVSSLPTFKTF